MASRVAIDVSTVVRGMTGVGHYTASVTAALADASSQDHRYLLVSNRSIEPPLAGTHESDVHPFPTRVGWLQFGLPRQLKRRGVDLVHFTNYMGTLRTRLPYVLTMYDMTLRLFPAKHQLRRAIVLGALQPFIARRAAFIITLSENSKDDIVRLMRVDPDRIRVIPAAADELFRPDVPEGEIRRVRVKYGLSGRYVLHVGTLEPRKNIPLLIEAFGCARRRAALPHSLVLAGAPGWKTGAIHEAARRFGDGFLKFLGYVDQADLPALYCGAELFVCASSYEGFGLPNIEALASGTPVITTRTSSIPEVVGNAAVLVPPDTLGSLADAICALATDEAARREFSDRGLHRASSFSWRRSARLTRAVYDETLGATEWSPVPVRPAARAHAPFTDAEYRFAMARLAYHDLFDYPLTVEQLMSGLNGHIPRDELTRIVAGEPLMRALAEVHGPYFTLKGRGTIVKERERRAAVSRDLIRRQRSEIDRIGRMPFVRMVAVSGALSYGNNSAGGDIDLFLIARSGRVWLTFLILVLRHHLSGKRATFCPNFMIGDRDLVIREQDFYNAQQLAGLQPLNGRRLFERFVASNSWIRRFCLSAPPDFAVAAVTEGSNPGRIERLLSGGVGDWLERCARSIGLRRMRSKARRGAPAVTLDADYIKLHFQDHRSRIVNRFRERLESVGLTLQDATPPCETEIAEEVCR